MQKQKQPRRLTLKTSTVAKLTPVQLERVAGGLTGSSLTTIRSVDEPGGP